MLPADAPPIPYEICLEEAPATISTDRAHALCEKFGITVRDVFYLPLFKDKIHESHLHEQKAANKAFATWKDTSPISTHFEIYDITVKVPSDVTELFKVRVYQSKSYEKPLLLLLFCFNDNEEIVDGKTIPWNPKNMRALSMAPVKILKALHEQGIPVDSLLATSLGNVAISSFKRVDREIVPETLIINRGFTSVNKLTKNFYRFPKSQIIKTIAKWTKWDTNPERSLLVFMKNKEPDEKRTVCIIEAEKDRFFSGRAKFDDDLHNKLQKLGVSTFRANFLPFSSPPRSHHSLPLNELERSSVIEETLDETAFPMEATMADTIVKHVFSQGPNGHTCLIVGGNEATFEKDHLRVILPLLNAFHNIQ